MTEKSCQVSSLDSEPSNNNDDNNKQNNNQSDHHLKQVSKASHKISKPIRRSPLDQLHDHHNEQLLQHQQQQQHLPPVYNINKSDFRDVVQKLTGSPAHERFSAPPPINPPKPPSSRLQRIRPPPLAHISTRPSLPPTSASTAVNSSNPSSFIFNETSNNGRQLVSPLSPLPPFPSVHAAAESPITAYMRYLRGSIPTLDSESKRLPGLSPLAPLVSPRFNNNNNMDLIPQQAQQALLLPSPGFGMGSVSQFMVPSSPLSFGSLISPSLLLSPSTAQLGLTQFVPPPLSPSWRNL